MQLLHSLLPLVPRGEQEKILGGCCQMRPWHGQMPDSIFSYASLPEFRSTLIRRAGRCRVANAISETLDVSNLVGRFPSPGFKARFPTGFKATGIRARRSRRAGVSESATARMRSGPTADFLIGAIPPDRP